MNTIESIDDEPISESTVILQAQQGDPEAFRFLYRRYKSYVAGQCRRRGCDPGLTEDLTQEVFLQLWRKIAQFKGQSSLKTWLYRITVNMVFDHFRGRGHNSLRAEFTAPSGDTFDPTERLCGKPCNLDDRVLISQIMSSLSPGDRRIMQLYTAGFKHREIAGILQIPRATSRSQLFRARAKIRRFNEEPVSAVKAPAAAAA